jgi:hypothetical protein
VIKTVLATALAAAVVAAIGQLAYQSFNFATGRSFIFASRDVIWMAPISYSAFMGLFAVGWAVAGLVIPRLGAPQVVAFVFSFLAVFVLMLRFSGLAIWAACVLAAGIAAQVAIHAKRHAGTWDRRALRVALRGLGALALIGVIGKAWSYTSGQRALAKLPSPAAGAPNVLLWCSMRCGLRG